MEEKEKIPGTKLTKPKSGIWVYFALGIIALLVICALIQRETSPTQKTTENPQIQPFSSSSANIAVRSEIVKKITPNLYRYFFFVTNNDSFPFEETVEIGLLEENGIQIAFDEFKPQSPIEPKQNRYYSVDSRWAPFEISRGSLVIERFEWRVHANYQTIQRGSGAITSKYEDASH